MARRVVEDLRTGETFIFADEWNDQHGQVCKLEYFLKPGHRVPMHLHPNTAQGFKVVSGTLHVLADGVTHALRPGDYIKTVYSGAHGQWNNGPDIVHAEEFYDPPLGIEPFFTKLPIVRQSRNPFKIAVFFDDFSRIVTSRFWLTRTLIAALAWVGHRLGYSDWYR